MALTRVAAAGINTGGTFVLENVNTSGIVTAGTVQVGSATTIHTTGIDLGSGNITSHNINSTGIITSTGGFVGAVTGNVTGNLTGNVTGNLTGDVTGDLTGNVTGDVTGDLTGNVTGNLTGNVTGNVSSSGTNTLGSLTVTNDATVGGALTVTGDFTVNGTTTTIDTAVTAVDSLSIDGNASVGGALTATGNITANTFYGDGSNVTNVDADTLDGINGASFLRSDAADTIGAKLTGGVTAGTDVIDFASNDNYASMRVIRNNTSSGGNADGMYIGYANGNNGTTRIYGGGTTGGGISIVGSGVNDVKIVGNTVWHAGNDGSGSGLDADTLDGYHLSAEGGPSAVGNFGQWENHGTYSDFNTVPSYWGWNYVQGNANAPNTGSSQWYRSRLSLGNGYGFGSDSGDYWLEMAIPRYNYATSAGGLWIRTCENGVENSWREVGSTGKAIAMAMVFG